MSNALVVQAAISKLQEAMEGLPDKLTAEDFVTNHHFIDGQYLRETHFPKGSIVIGQVHREDHMLMLLKGKCLVASSEGLKMLTAGYIGVAKRGTQRAGFAVEDCIFVTSHATTETDVNKLEHQLIALNRKSLEVQ